MSINVSERRTFWKWFTRVLGKSKHLPKVLKEIMYGMTIHEMDLELRRERGSLDHLYYAGGFWRSCRIAFASSLLFDATFTLYSSFHRDMEEKSVEGERPDRFRSGGYWIGGKIHEGMEREANRIVIIGQVMDDANQ